MTAIATRLDYHFVPLHSEAPPAYSVVASHAVLSSSIDNSQISVSRKSLPWRSKKRPVQDQTDRIKSLPRAMATPAYAPLPPTIEPPKRDIDLSISVNDSVCFVYPNADSTGADETEVESSTSARRKAYFVVTINVSTSQGYTSALRRIASLDVELCAKQTLFTPSGFFESNQITTATIQVSDAASYELQNGQSRSFEALVEVPASSSPFELQRHGCHTPYLKATLKLANAEPSRSPTESNSRKKTSSWLDKALSTIPRTRTLTAKEDVYIVAVPRSDNRLEYSRTHHTSAEGLGPIAAHVRTDALAVGGYLRLGLALPAMSQNSKVRQIDWNVIQRTSLRSQRNSAALATTPQRFNLVSVTDADDLQELLLSQEMMEGSTEEGQAMLGVWNARLPTDDLLRPTTLDTSTEAAIRVSHQVELRITFQSVGDALSAEQDKERAVFCVSWPVTVASCLCRPQSVILPSYHAEDPHPRGDAMVAMAEITKRRATVMREWRRRNASLKDIHSFCTCGSTLEELLNHEADADAIYGRRPAESIVLSELMSSLISPHAAIDTMRRRGSVVSRLLTRSERSDSVVSNHSTSSPMDEWPVPMTEEEAQERMQAQRIAEKAQQSYCAS